MKCRIYRFDKNIPLPSKQNITDAGYDVYSFEEVEIPPGETKLVDLGIIAEAPSNWHFELFLRSSTAWKKGLRMGNSVGLIDHLYCGKSDRIKIMLWNPGKSSYLVKQGERIGQLLLKRNQDVEWLEQDSPDFAEIGSRGGFGSTGDM